MEPAIESHKAFREYVSLLLALHVLVSSRDEDGEQAAAVRDRMDIAWERMSSKLQEMASGLAVDLGLVRGDPTPMHETSASEQAIHLHLFRSSLQAKSWEQALVHLRACGPSIQRAGLAWFFARCWSELGLFEAALVFYETARELLPREEGLAMSAFDCLTKVDPSIATQRALEILSKSEDHLVAEVVRAGSFIYHQTLVLATTDHSPVLKRLVAVLLASFDRIVKIGDSKQRGIVAALGALVAGSGLEMLGRPSEAEAAYERGLKLKPRDSILRMARGLLLYGKDTRRALDDFHHALEHRCPVVWPAFFLAHNAIFHGQHEQCLRYCDLAERFPAPVWAFAHVLEWTAISRFEIGDSLEEVRPIMQRAHELAPDNPVITANWTTLLALEAARTKGETSRWTGAARAALTESAKPEFRLEAVALEMARTARPQPTL
jgi:tetratricopeptide (TPR) repeat protein